jgi:hypothetical protein
MSNNDLDDKEFQPRIGFEKSEQDSSFSFSDFNQKSLRSDELLKESEKVSEEFNENLKSFEELNDSKGLNQAFCQEKSESVSLGEPVKFLDELEEKTELKIMNFDPVDKEPKINSNLIISPSNTIPKAEENGSVLQMRHSVKENKKNCCKKCNIF